MHKTWQQAFTLIEVSIVIVVIGILVVIGSVSYTETQRRAKQAAAEQDLTVFARAAMRYKADNGAYPASEQDFAALNIQLDKAVYSEDNSLNVIYCSYRPYAEFALVAVTKTDKIIAVVNDGAPQEVTDQNIINVVNRFSKTNAASPICAKFLVNYPTDDINQSEDQFHIAAFNKNSSSAGWQSWSGK